MLQGGSGDDFLDGGAASEKHSKDGVIYTLTDSALTVRLPAPYAGISSTTALA